MSTISKPLKKELQQRKEPRLANILSSEIRTAPQFARAMSALMSDLVDETISPKIANAVCNAGGKLLKVVEMNYRYGKPGTKEKSLLLVPDTEG